MMPLFLRSRYIQTNCLVQNCCFSSNGSFKNVIFSDISPLLLSFKMVYKLHHHFRNMFDLLFDTLYQYHWICISSSACTFKLYENVYFGLSHKLSLQKAKAFKEFRHSFIRK